MLVDIHENVRVGVAERSQIEGGFGARFVLQSRFQCGGSLRFKKRKIRLSHLQLNEFPATRSLRKKGRLDFGRCPVLPADIDSLSGNGPPRKTFKSPLAPRPRRNEEDDTVREIDLDGDVNVIPPTGPELLAIAIEEPICLFQAEEFGLDVGFQRSRREL
jgi:hypothetical protein